MNSRKVQIFREKTAESDSSLSLSSALAECRSSARRGYEIARKNLEESAKAITGASKALKQCLKSLEDRSLRTPDIVDQLRGQLSGVASELEQLQRMLDSELEERRQRLDNFSVTLFGRTMAGKSTLMEILTRGEEAGKGQTRIYGESIGTGAQRMTRDVRHYPWNGLSVTDVPGVAAFEGENDEEIAFKAASQADLLLFLITDDAPQPIEAEFLARVCQLGKPVLGICNIKVALDDEDDLILFLRNPDRPFSRIRINQIIDQFHSFAEQHLPGKRVPFFATHLRSRFLAELPKYAAHRNRLIVASRFDEIEAKIAREVIQRGKFFRIKSFVDGAVVPMMDVSEMLLKFSETNSSSGRVLIDKRRQLGEWSKGFDTHGQERINTLVSKTMSTLRNEVPSFAEDNFEDRNAGENWARLVKSLQVDGKIANLQNDLLHECKKALSDVGQELRSELSLIASLSGDRQIKMDRIADLKKTWKWGVATLAGGLEIAALVLASGPLGWAAIAVGVGGWLFSMFFDDHEEKAQRARAKLTKRILENIDAMERDIGRRLGDWFHKEILGQQVYVLRDDFGAVTSGLFALADTQRALAWALNERQKALGRALVEEALIQLKAEKQNASLKDVARVPGFAIMFLIAPKTEFPVHIRDGLERLLGEKILFVVDTKNPRSILAQAIGQACDRNKIRLEEKIQVAHVPFDDLHAEANARIRLAQQLTGFHVMKQR